MHFKEGSLVPWLSCPLGEAPSWISDKEREPAPLVGSLEERGFWGPHFVPAANADGGGGAGASEGGFRERNVVGAQGAGARA